VGIKTNKQKGDQMGDKKKKQNKTNKLGKLQKETE